MPEKFVKKRIRFRKYDLDDFDLIKVLGRGSFGKVSYLHFHTRKLSRKTLFLYLPIFPPSSTLSLSLSHSHSLSLTLTHSHSLSLTHSFIHSNLLFFSLTLTFFFCKGIFGRAQTAQCLLRNQVSQKARGGRRRRR